MFQIELIELIEQHKAVEKEMKQLNLSTEVGRQRFIELGKQSVELMLKIKRIERCPACHRERFGVKGRIASPHNCGKYE